MTDDRVIEKALEILEKRMHRDAGFMHNHNDISKYLRLKLGQEVCEAFYVFYLTPRTSSFSMSKSSQALLHPVTSILAKLYVRLSSTTRQRLSLRTTIQAALRNLAKQTTT
jgi:hypothetical protein